jgi:uncharacterized protein (TIGR03437 family)
MRAGLLPLCFSMVLQAGQVVYQKNVPATAVGVDAAGNVYTAGSSTVSKLDPNGNIVYSKQVNLPGDWNGFAVDSMGNVLIAGVTSADNLPVTPGVFQSQRNSKGMCVSGDMAAKPVPCPDAFVAKLDANGNLAWATYLGGSAQDQADAVAVDPSGNIYVAGLTQSSDFPSVSGFQSSFGGYADGFVTKISADGTRILYSSFLGGAGYDVAHAIVVDSLGNAYVAGELQGIGLAVTAGSFGPTCQANATNAFLIKVAPGGDHLVFAGCLGGDSSFSAATAVALDGTGEPYIGGFTNSTSFPSTSGAFQSRMPSPEIDFVAKISGDGSTLIYSSLFEGASFGIFSIAVDPGGSAYITGETGSTAIPIAGPALQPCPGPTALTYNFLLKLNPAGSAASYLSFEEAPARVALAADGSLYEALGLLRKITALDTPGGPFLSRMCVLNGASFASHLQDGQPGISPGEIVALKGTGLGPSAPPPGPVVINGAVGASLAGVQVLFDGVPAPLLYVQDKQINVVAPYSLIGKTQTSIQVQYAAQTTQPVAIPVSPLSPAVFENFKTGEPLVLNQDFSVNTVANAAARGSAIVLFITGAGQTSPPSTDGQVWQTIGGLQASVSASIQNINISPIVVTAPVLYAGPAPTLVSGVQQVNIQIPASLPPSFFSPVTGGNGFVNVTIGSQTITVPVVVK